MENNNDYIIQMIEQAVAFEKSNQLDLALNIYNVALQLLPESEKRARAQVLRLRGHICYRLNNKAEALDNICEAMDLDPTLVAELSGDFSRYYHEGCNGGN